MKKALLFIFLIALTSLVQAAKITDNVLHVGPKATDEFTILHKDGGYLKKTGSKGDWFFSKDGVLEKKIGSGSGSGGDGGVNILLNASFEDGLTNWTNSGGTLTQETYTTGSESNTKFARFVASGAGQYVESDCTDKPDFLSGGGMADIRYTTTDDQLFELKVFDCTTSDVEISTATVAAQADWGKIPTQTFDLENKLKLRVISLGAASIDFDLGYTGSNKGFIASEERLEKVRISLDGTWNPVINTDDIVEFNASNNSDYPVTGGCVTIQKAGRYNIKNFTVNNGSNDTMFLGYSVNGAVTKKSQSLLSSTNGAGSRNYFHGIFTDNLSSGDVVCGILNINTARVQVNPYMEIEQLADSGTTEAFTPEQADFFIDASIGGGNPVIGGGGPTEVSHSSLDMVLNSGSAKIPCSTTNPATGLTCAAGNEVLGIVFNAPRAGRYKVCSSVPYSTGDSAVRQAVVDNGSTNIVQLGKGMILGGSSNGDSDVICDFFDFDSTGEKTVKLFKEGVNAITFFVDRDPNRFERDFNITVEMVGHNVSRPIIQNMVDTSTGSGVRVNSCEVNNNGTSTIETSSGLCEAWVSSVNTFATGQVLVSINNGVYSKNPVCTANHAGGGQYFAHVEVISPTSIQVNMRLDNGALINGDFSISCQGAR